jgi:hypothetical protein
VVIGGRGPLSYGLTPERHGPVDVFQLGPRACCLRMGRGASNRGISATPIQYFCFGRGGVHWPASSFLSRFFFRPAVMASQPRFTRHARIDNERRLFRMRQVRAAVIRGCWANAFAEFSGRCALATFRWTAKTRSSVQPA